MSLISSHYSKCSKCANRRMESVSSSSSSSSSSGSLLTTAVQLYPSLACWTISFIYLSLPCSSILCRIFQWRT